MKLICGKRHWNKHTRRNQDCHNKVSSTCTDCGEKLCWQHFKQKCPDGRKTKYGSWQHLSQEQKNEMTKATQFRLQKVRLTKEIGEDGEAKGPREPEKLTVDFSYLTAERVRRMIVIYPGGIRSAGEDQNWKPDDELHRWMGRRNGSAQQTFMNREHAVAVVTALLRGMRQKPSTSSTATN